MSQVTISSICQFLLKTLSWIPIAGIVFHIWPKFDNYRVENWYKLYQILMFIAAGFVWFNKLLDF